MKKLSTFLANYIGTRIHLSPKPILLELIRDAIEAYKEHLKMDVPRTAGWVMREKEMIAALERMEAETHEPEEWKCPRCSYMNSLDNEECRGSEMGDGRCGYPKEQSDGKS